jgi:nickel-dependent lactate racemase
MKYSLPYGNSSQTLLYSHEKEYDIILPNHIASISKPSLAIKKALLEPLDEINLINMKGKKVGIAVNDTTRPVPNNLLLPPLLEYLLCNGANKEDISFFIASGTHKQTDLDEVELIFPSTILTDYSIYRHDCDDDENLIHLGETARHTPIYVNKHFFQMEIKIVVGNIEPHHFMGYSGGAKSAAIGLAGRETIRLNHSHLLEKESFIGNYENNPTRLDMKEIGDKIGVTAALNVVLNAEKQIVQVLWGSPRAVMQAGIPISRQVCQKKIDRLYDLVVASPGGYPKDINLYQAQKAITHVSMITRTDGIIILVAECREGLGSKEFEEYLSHYASPKEVVEIFQNSKFEIGPHKAYQLALQANRNRIILVSSMEPALVQKTHLDYSQTIEDAMKLVNDTLSPNAKKAIVPYATNTMLY